MWCVDDKLHNEFIVQPNASVSQIKLNVKWADVIIKDNQSVIYSTPLGAIKEGSIDAYYPDRQKIIAHYEKDDNGYLTFRVQKYDQQKTLIIDPPLERLWATYYGGNDQENCDGSREIGAITTDAVGNVYITGFTKSNNFPLYNPGGGAYFQGSLAGQFDIFIVKFNNLGVRQWATYYGGSSDDMGIAITSDYLGNLYITGNTFSSNLPTYNPGGNAYFQSTNGGSCDIFILKFTENGVRLWATYYGGFGSDVGYAITTDADANLLITGNTYSTTNFPLFDPGGGAYFQATHAGGIYDAYILKFSNTGARLWATYYGGSDEDHGYGITTDSLGNIFVTGMTRSNNFPLHDAGGGAYFQNTIGGYRTAFILKFTNMGQRQWATYYGGSINDYGRAIATDNLGDVYVVGNTSSTNFPTFNPGGTSYYQGTLAGSDDAFILKFNNNGVRLWATYYGGSSGDIARAITIHNSRQIYITGNTLSSNFPTYDLGGGAFYQGTLSGGHEIFILGFSPIGERFWATYYGGSSTDYGMSIATDSFGNIFVTGFSLSSNFPTLNPFQNAYYQGTNAGSYDAYIIKFACYPIAGIYEQNPQTPSNNFKLYTSTFFRDEIILKLNQIKTQTITLTLHNSSGELIYTKKLAYTPLLILNDYRIKNLASGIYFLKINTNSQLLKTIKLIKQ